MTKSSAENISLKNEIDHLKQELSTTRDEVQRLTRRLEESEGLYTRVKSYSDDLRRQLDQAGEELTYYKAISQNDEAANPPVNKLDNDPQENTVDHPEQGHPTAGQSGFVYDAATGQYFDSTSGYYYDPIKQLYYEPESSVFYRFDQTSQSYQLMSATVEAVSESNATKASSPPASSAAHDDASYSVEIDNTAVSNVDCENEKDTSTTAANSLSKVSESIQDTNKCNKSTTNTALYNKLEPSSSLDDIVEDGSNTLVENQGKQENLSIDETSTCLETKPMVTKSSSCFNETSTVIGGSNVAESSSHSDETSTVIGESMSSVCEDIASSSEHITSAGRELEICLQLVESMNKIKTLLIPHLKEVLDSNTANIEISKLDQVKESLMKCENAANTQPDKCSPKRDQSILDVESSLLQLLDQLARFQTPSTTSPNRTEENIGLPNAGSVTPEVYRQTLRKVAKLEHVNTSITRYNEDLCQQLESLKTELHAYRHGDNRRHVLTQVDLSLISDSSSGVSRVQKHTDNDQSEPGVAMATHSAEIPIAQDMEEREEGEISLAESLRDTAEEALSKSGFVFDDRTGLYYDHASGYYYDGENGLYYEPNSGTYYCYDQESGSYQIHSQVDVSQHQRYQDLDAPCDEAAQETVTMETAAIETSVKHKKHKRGSRGRKSSEDSRMDRKKKKRKKERKHNTDDEHSDSDDGSDKRKKRHRKHKKIKSKHKKKRKRVKEEATSDSDGEKNLEGEKETQEQQEEMTDESASAWPPCIRVIVHQSDHLTVGSLFIITCTGATIGREKDMGHAILIPDMQISKMHAQIWYNEATMQYVIKDHASQNGTFINAHRIGQPKVMSEVYPLSHGDTLTLGGSTLLLHIHRGTETCDECEPGQVQASLQQQQQDAEQEKVIVLSKEERERQRRLQLKRIKKKFGLADSAYVDNKRAIKNTKYEDKSEQRRKTVGSDNPYQRDDLPASVDRALPAANVGHKLLQKMGWTEGSSLGKGQTGIKEPIRVNIRLNRKAGLGQGSSLASSLDQVTEVATAEKWVRARERFQRLDKQSRDDEPGATDPNKPASPAPSHTWVSGGTIQPEKPTINAPSQKWVSGGIVQPQEPASGDQMQTVQPDKSSSPSSHVP